MSLRIIYDVIKQKKKQQMYRFNTLLKSNYGT